MYHFKTCVRNPVFVLFQKMLNSFKQYFKILKVFFKQQKITYRLLDSTVTAVILTKF